MIFNLETDYLQHYNNLVYKIGKKFQSEQFFSRETEFKSEWWHDSDLSFLSRKSERKAAIETIACLSFRARWSRSNGCGTRRAARIFSRFVSRAVRSHRQGSTCTRRAHRSRASFTDNHVEPGWTEVETHSHARTAHLCVHALLLPPPPPPPVKPKRFCFDHSAFWPYSIDREIVARSTLISENFIHFCVAFIIWNLGYRNFSFLVRFFGLVLLGWFEISSSFNFITFVQYIYIYGSLIDVFIFFENYLLRYLLIIFYSFARKYSEFVIIRLRIFRNLRYCYRKIYISKITFFTDIKRKIKKLYLITIIK